MYDEKSDIWALYICNTLYFSEVHSAAQYCWLMYRCTSKSLISGPCTYVIPCTTLKRTVLHCTVDWCTGVRRKVSYLGPVCNIMYFSEVHRAALYCWLVYRCTTRSLTSGPWAVYSTRWPAFRKHLRYRKGAGAEHYCLFLKEALHIVPDHVLKRRQRRIQTGAECSMLHPFFSNGAALPPCPLFKFLTTSLKHK